MTNLVTRLRSRVVYEPYQLEAADEIERRQKELAECRKDAERYQVIRVQNITQINAEREHWEQECTVELFDKMLDEEIAAMKQEEV